jgi:hypothetical protein
VTYPLPFLQRVGAFLFPAAGHFSFYNGNSKALCAQATPASKDPLFCTGYYFAASILSWPLLLTAKIPGMQSAVHTVF